MPVRSVEHEYEFVEEAVEARQLSIQGGGTGSVKAVVKVCLGALSITLVALAWARRGAMGPARAPTSGMEVAEQFEVKRFPEDCGNFMRFTGCEKERWTCDADDDDSDEYRCCCETKIWDSQTRQAPLKVTGGSGVSVLRLEKSMGVCLGGPEGGASHFSLASCDDKRARLTLPVKGSGPVKLESEKGKCLGVVGRKGHRHIEVVSCSQGDADQRFQLTDGNTGMLQWSHSGNLCLDTEDDSTGAGSKIVLGDCVYWPKKKSQVYTREEAPEPVEKHKDDDDEEKALTHPSLFCTSLMLPWSYEVDMLRSQIARNVGIFQCDAWAVFSNKKVKLKEGATPDEDIYCDIINGSLKAKVGGKFHTALNTPIFQRFWRLLMIDGRAWHYDWTIKVDPDCVFFPYRLKGMLANEYETGTPREAVWLNNCQLGLHGPIEVFTKQALGAFKDSHGACDEAAKDHGQEDVFLRHCFTKIKLPKIDAFNILLESEWACNERPSSSTNMPPCYDRQVAFHPFKTVESYFNCYEKAAKMSWSTPLYFNSVPPNSNNAHHS